LRAPTALRSDATVSASGATSAGVGDEDPPRIAAVAGSGADRETSGRPALPS
jgi:hypothetical protein